MDTESQSKNKHRLSIQDFENEISSPTSISESPSTYFETKPQTLNIPESLSNDFSSTLDSISPYSVTDYPNNDYDIASPFSEPKSPSPFYEPETPSTNSVAELLSLSSHAETLFPLPEVENLFSDLDDKYLALIYSDTMKVGYVNILLIILYYFYLTI